MKVFSDLNDSMILCTSCLLPQSLAVLEGPSSASFSVCYLAVSVYQIFQTGDAETKTSSLVPEGNSILGLTYRLRNEL